MMKSITAALALTATAILGLTAIPARAHGAVSCDVPRAERKPSVQLQRQLRAAGWKIKKMQNYNGCYEVYGFDEAGNSVEAFFDPRTLVRIPVEM
jgi:hypothetical protein